MDTTFHEAEKYDTFLMIRDLDWPLRGARMRSLIHCNRVCPFRIVEIETRNHSLRFSVNFSYRIASGLASEKLRLGIGMCQYYCQPRLIPLIFPFGVVIIHVQNP